jgi:hypothetical protein
MKLSRLILALLATVMIYAQSTVAQEVRPPTDADNRAGQPDTALPEYVVEVRRPEGCLVGPISTKTRDGFVLYALPRPTRFPRGQGVASKVLVYAAQKGDGWHVSVSIGTGEFYDAGDANVGEFVLGPNQRTIVPDFSRFGLEPIRVGVVRIIRREAGSPHFTNLTQSVSLESLQTNNLPDPYKLQLKNNSGTDLIAIQYNTFRRNQFLDLKWLSDGLTKPLIKAGQTYELKVSSEDNTCGDEEGYSPGQSNRIDLVSAVFADGTVEGEVGLAALIKGAALGNRKNLERVVQTLGHLGDDPTQLANELNNLQVGMNEEDDPYLLDALQSLVPSIPEDSAPVLNAYIRSGMHDVKVNLERDAKYFQIMTRRNNALINKEWVERTKAKYERWLAAAQRITAQ